MQVFLIMLADIKEEIMELKEILNKPYTDNEAIDFITLNNAIRKYKIVETENALEAWDYTEEEKADQERQWLDMLSLTKREVFLALYKDKGITPDMIKAQIQDEEALIEFEYAGEYFRGNPLINTIGQMLGYTSEQLDYMFKNKELPNDNVV